MSERRARTGRGRQRGASAVDVVAILGIVLVLVGLMVFVGVPEVKRARLRTAKRKAILVSEAASAYLRDPTHADVCPTVQELVAAGRLGTAPSVDPWNSPYAVRCEGDEIHGVSAGADRKMGTADDVWDNTPLERSVAYCQMP